MPRPALYFHIPLPLRVLPIEKLYDHFFLRLGPGCTQCLNCNTRSDWFRKGPLSHSGKMIFGMIFGLFSLRCTAPRGCLRFTVPLPGFLNDFFYVAVHGISRAILLLYELSHGISFIPRNEVFLYIGAVFLLLHIFKIEFKI